MKVIVIPLFSKSMRFIVQFSVTISYTFAMYYLINYRSEPASENLIPISLLYIVLLFVFRGNILVYKSGDSVVVRCLLFFRYKFKLNQIDSIVSVDAKNYSGLGIGLRWLPGQRIFVPTNAKSGISIKYKRLEYILLGPDEKMKEVIKNFDRGTNVDSGLKAL